MDAFLTEINLAQHATILDKLGYDDPNDFAEFEASDLKKLETRCTDEGRFVVPWPAKSNPAAKQMTLGRIPRVWSAACKPRQLRRQPELAEGYGTHDQARRRSCARGLFQMRGLRAASVASAQPAAPMAVTPAY